MGVALDSDGGRESSDGDGAVELGEGVGDGLTEPMAGSEEAHDGDEDDESGEGEEGAAEEDATSGFFWREGQVGNDLSVGEVGRLMDLSQV